MKLNSLADWMQKIMEDDNLKNHIEKFQGLRQIIDTQYQFSKRFIDMNIQIWFFGYIVPLILQTGFAWSVDTVIIFNWICLGT